MALPVGCVASDDSAYDSYIFDESCYDRVFGHDKEGNSNIDTIISEETQKVIDGATAKTLSELNLKFSKELETHLSNIKKTKSDYNKYCKSDRA